MSRAAAEDSRRDACTPTRRAGAVWLMVAGEATPEHPDPPVNFVRGRGRSRQPPAAKIVVFPCVPFQQLTPPALRRDAGVRVWGRWVGPWGRGRTVVDSWQGSRTQALLSALQDHGSLPCRPVTIRRFSGTVDLSALVQFCLSGMDYEGKSGTIPSIFDH